MKIENCKIGTRICLKKNEGAWATRDKVGTIIHVEEDLDELDHINRSRVLIHFNEDIYGKRFPHIKGKDRHELWCSHENLKEISELEYLMRCL